LAAKVVDPYQSVIASPYRPFVRCFTVGLAAATRTIVEPGTSDELLLRPPGPGAYPFVCTIHDGMAGTLIVRPSVSEAG
jgi:hypothetical protein